MHSDHQPTGVPGVGLAQVFQLAVRSAATAERGEIIVPGRGRFGRRAALSDAGRSRQRHDQRPEPPPGWRWYRAEPRRPNARANRPVDWFRARGVVRFSCVRIPASDAWRGRPAAWRSCRDQENRGPMRRLSAQGASPTESIGVDVRRGQGRRIRTRTSPGARDTAKSPAGRRLCSRSRPSRFGPRLRPGLWQPIAATGILTASRRGARLPRQLHRRRPVSIARRRLRTASTR